MTLSEYEQRALAGIETGCRVDDPAFAARLDAAVARTRRIRETLIATWVIWVGSFAFVIGIVTARSGASAGLLIACCAAPAVVVSVCLWVRDGVRSTGHRRK